MRNNPISDPLASHKLSRISGWYAHPQTAAFTSKLNGPNCVTGIRLVLLPLVWIGAFQDSPRTVGGLIAFALITDGLDGYLARRLGQETSFGAKFDSFADNLFLCSAPFLVYLLEPGMVARNLVPCALFVGLLGAVFAVMFAKHRRNVEIHTYLSKLGVVVMWSFLIFTFLVGYDRFFFMLTLATSYLYLGEDLILLLTRRQIDENVKGLLFD